ncbi:MAG TPA: hypothetical protein VEQ63_16595, partial [Bryobacteraceae bacterium]|nr:hypothetical protein [Bryobacteraceae bacterium]
VRFQKHGSFSDLIATNPGDHTIRIAGSADQGIRRTKPCGLNKWRGTVFQMAGAFQPGLR